VVIVVVTVVENTGSAVQKRKLVETNFPGWFTLPVPFECSTLISKYFRLVLFQGSYAALNQGKNFRPTDFVIQVSSLIPTCTLNCRLNKLGTPFHFNT